MDSYEWNRLAGWVLAAAIAILGLSIITGMVYSTEAPATKGYKVEGVVEEVATTGAPAEQPIAVFLASADPAKGEGEFKKCAACHTINQGGANQIGPNLWGVMGNPVAAHAGYSYSDALRGLGGEWNWDAMSSWLKSPKKHAPGNKMSFAGISDPQSRANLMAYLNAQDSQPLPLPPVPAADAAPTDAAAAAAPAAADGAPPTGEVPAEAQGMKLDTAVAPEPAAGPGKAKDVGDVEEVGAATAVQPQGNRGGPGAADVTGTSGREVNRN